MRNLVLTLIGPDRPGLVEKVSDLVVRHGGNWLGSRMAHLAGQFAGILQVEVPEERVATLRGDLDGLQSRMGLRLHIEDDVVGDAAPADRNVVLDLVGQDRPGIVKELSQFFASRGVNVEDLTTDRESAAMSGERLFRARVRVALPADVTVESLRSGLERIADDLMVEIRFDPTQPA